jgi:hypothetical protein
MTSRSLIEPWGSQYPMLRAEAVRVASPDAHNQSRAGKLFRSGRPGAKSISSLAGGVGFGDVTTVACGLNATRVAEPPKARR